jgi:hypothetical protein
MTTTIETTKVTGRRTLRFNTLDDILADIEKLAQAKDVRSLGNWTPGQIMKHLAIGFNNSIDGSPPIMPGPVRFILRLFFKRRLLTKPMSPGFKLPKRAESLLPPPTNWEDGLTCVREGLNRLGSETKRASNPVVGSLTVDEIDQLHCRHAELHLSFLVF